MTEIVRIPSERVKVLVGKGGQNKRRIEKRCNVGLSVDSEGEIQIDGDPAEVFFAKDVVKAIGRGFDVDDALRLLKHDYGFYIISLKEVTSSEQAIIRLKGRVIGEKGSIKSQIESATDSTVSVYGNTVSIISRIDSMEYAKEAVTMLINGAKHSTVLSYLAKARRELMKERLRG